MAKKVTLKPDDKTVDLTRHAQRIALLLQTRKEIKEMEAFAEQVEAEIQQVIVDQGGTVGTINGVPIFTYRQAEAYAMARFREAHPEVYAKYLVKQETEVVDMEALIAKHGASLLAPFKSRRLNYVGS